jgi:hypothetical protein
VTLPIGLWANGPSVQDWKSNVHLGSAEIRVPAIPSVFRAGKTSASSLSDFGC